MNMEEKVDTEDLSSKTETFLQCLIKQEHLSLLQENVEINSSYMLEKEIKSECTAESFVESTGRENEENSKTDCPNTRKSTIRSSVICTEVKNKVEECTDRASYLLSCVDATLNENEESTVSKNSESLHPNSIKEENIDDESSNSNNVNINIIDNVLHPKDNIQDLLSRSLEDYPSTSTKHSKQNLPAQASHTEHISDTWRQQFENDNDAVSDHFLIIKSIQQFENKERFGKTTVTKKSYKCDMCGKCFVHKQSYNVHILIHEGVKKFKCNECNKEFMSRNNLRRHIALHSDVRDKYGSEVENYKCDFCERRFMKKYSLLLHIKNVHVPMSHKVNYKCEVCGKCFAYKQSFQYHTMLHAGRVKKFKCDDCNHIFMNRAELRSHVITHTGSKNYKCYDCHKCYFHKQGIRKHIITHHMKFNVKKCEKCNKVFLTQENLRKHKILHTGAKNFKCGYCNKCFTFPQTLNRHKLTHTDEKKYNCEICGRHFLLKQNLQKHVELHDGVKNYKCLECGKCFNRNDTLKKHKAIHKDVKAYKCDECPKCFYHKGHLDRHKRITHNSNGSGSLKCDLCETYFLCKNDLKRHIVIHLSDTYFKCVKCGKCYTLKNSLMKHIKRIHQEHEKLNEEETILGF